ncbi:hypothetical protein KEM52_001720 [Ascosphaera acerosa]|nr:hypothetical protein KEM52_001720 [Ascosphaera acerosa]
MAASRRSDLEIRKSRRREDYPFIIPCQTRWSDNDMFAHLNNTAYMHLVDTVVIVYLIRHAGLNPFFAREVMHAASQGSISTAASASASATSDSVPPQIAFVANAYCDYLGSVSFPDILDLGLRVLKVGRSSVTYEVGIFRQGEDAVKVVGGYTHVFVDRTTHRPSEGGMQPQFRRALEAINLGMEGATREASPGETNVTKTLKTDAKL